MENVGKSISWNAGLYDARHDFVYTFGEDLLRLFNPQEGEEILDLGCGTGHLTDLIGKRGANVIGIDSSPEMIVQAQKAYPQGAFEQMDACQIPWKERFDGIFSNAVLHWILDKEAAISCMYHCLKKGGRLVMEMGGKGNVDYIISATRKVLADQGYTTQSEVNPWYFPSIGEYSSLLESVGFTVKFALHFERETELSGEDGIKNWLEMFGHYFFDKIPSAEIPDIISKVKEILRPTNFKGGKWFAFYQRLRIIAVKDAG